MEILILSFVCAVSYLIIVIKIMGVDNVVRLQVPLDIIFTIGVPFLFIGTYSGMITAFISGVAFSVITFVLGILHKPRPLLRFPYGKQKTTKANGYGPHPPRS